MGKHPLTFDEARLRVLELDESMSSQLGSHRIWVRDLFGRITLYAQGANIQGETIELLSDSLERYAGQPPLIRLEDSILGPLLIHAPGREPIAADGSSFFLERYLMGSEWLGNPLPNNPPVPPRVVFYGLKGGVGRSTALAVWARYLAEAHAKKVLVVDLDLESPGVSSILLGSTDRPRYGIVDWFVESAVGQGERVLADMVATSPLGRGLDGSIHVAPASGAGGDYLRKLNRVYLDVPGPSGSVRFADRLATLVDVLEAEVDPDVVLLDSRAGLHDIAAVALTRLGALNLLFAVDTGQTWEGYGHLFEHWHHLSSIDREAFNDLRGRLQMVAGQIPELEQSEYFERIRANAYGLFLTLYDEEDDPEDVSAFNYAIDAEDAPHHPLRIHWNRAFQEYDPQRKPGAVTPEQLHAAFGEFFSRATGLLLSEAEEDE